MIKIDKFRKTYFHAFRQGVWKGSYFTRHWGEFDGDEVINVLQRRQRIPKEKCFAIVLNRFRRTSNNDRLINSYANLARTTGYLTLDVDHAGRKVLFYQRKLFSLLPELLVVWISASGDGVKAIGWRKELKGLKCPKLYWETYKSICEELRLRSCPEIKFDYSAGRAHQLVFINQNAYPLIRKS